MNTSVIPGKKIGRRRKIKIEKIKMGSKLQVTFTKRRNGMFKKASELCIFTGAEVGIIIFSPGGGKVYSFGHPDITEITERFASSSINFFANNYIQDQGINFIMEILVATQERLENEKKHAEEIDEYRKSSLNIPHWNELNLEQLKGWEAALKNFLAILDKQEFGDVARPGVTNFAASVPSLVHGEDNNGLNAP